MAQRRRFKNLHRAILWRRHHLKRRIQRVVVYSNPPIKPVQTFEQRLVAYCHVSLTYAGRMYYTMGAMRDQLFHRTPGDFKGAHADCSQFVSAMVHWLGSKIATDTDATGSMLDKYAHLGGPRVGCGVVFGAAPGEHIGVCTEKVGDDWYVVAFGHNGAPDKNRLSVLKKYFADNGHPGVTYLDLSKRKGT